MFAVGVAALRMLSGPTLARPEFLKSNADELRTGGPSTAASYGFAIISVDLRTGGSSTGTSSPLTNLLNLPSKEPHSESSEFFESLFLSQDPVSLIWSLSIPEQFLLHSRMMFTRGCARWLLRIAH